MEDQLLVEDTETVDLYPALLSSQQVDDSEDGLRFSLPKGVVEGDILVWS